MSEAYKIQQHSEIKITTTDNKQQKNTVYQTHHRPNKLPKLYKIIYFIGSLVIILTALAVINLDNKVTALSTEINQQEAKIEKRKVAIKELEQEESELSQVDRIMKIAQKAGLKQINDNIRTVKK